MTAAVGTVLIMAAGTGGHVFPAMSIAACLRARNIDVQWLGTPTGMENELLEKTDYKLHQITVSGLRGSGIHRKVMAPMMLLKAFAQSVQLIRSIKPDCVLGMGGFVCGPAGLASRLLGVPLLIHEQNAVAGFTNKVLARVAVRVLQAFPETFPASAKVRLTGNPLRSEIIALHALPPREIDRLRPLRLLVLGGSQGAESINRLLPEVIANWNGERPSVYHQTGAAKHRSTRELYESLGVEPGDHCRVTPFIDDMAAAYQWADIVISRSGASTVSEIAAAGVASILVPYPHHKDQQQVFNARWLADKNAAYLVEQRNLTANELLTLLLNLDANRPMLKQMSAAARRMAVINAAELIAAECREFTHGAN